MPTNYYDNLFARLERDGIALPAIVERVASAYLDGRPSHAGKRKLRNRERDGLFWSSNVVKVCSPETWGAGAMSLALARYLGQEHVAADELVSRIAREAPEALHRAVRQSGLVLKPHSPRRAELDRAATESEAVAELCRVMDLFALAHRERSDALDALKKELEGLSVFDFFIYASLYAFETLVPRDFTARDPQPPGGADLQLAWDALGDLLTWKLAGVNPSSLTLTDEIIGRSLAGHLHPILFEAEETTAGEAPRNLRAFHALMDAQIESNEFGSRSVDAFCYDASIWFERRGERLDIVEVDPAKRSAWARDGLKLERLYMYWFCRAVDSYCEQVTADRAMWMIGRSENADANRLAWIRALQGRLRLQEAYGVADEVTTDSGAAVDLFQALLSLNLMSMFFYWDFLVAYTKRLDASGDWIVALRRLALDGLRDGQQNRLPITWSSRDTKVSNITGWTVTESEPRGDPRMAAAILEFWTYDLAATAERLRRDATGLRPELLERPILKFGATLVQMPWVVGLQNNSSAAINNLRRLGARRSHARDEARRIEAGLARLFQKRGFRTLLNWVPPRHLEDPGEVDLIAALDGRVCVIEVKSTFLRRSKREAWLHATSTLRKAGEQLRRKVTAVSDAISSNSEFCAALDVGTTRSPCVQHAWIADTSIEWDHQRFSGFLKVSVEELIIALRDDRHLLNDPEGLFVGNLDFDKIEAIGADTSESGWSLYPDGFSAERFVEVIETEAVWALGNNVYNAV